MAEDVISGLVKGNESLNRQFIDNLTSIDVSRMANERIKFDHESIVISSGDIISSDILIWGHETFGIWGTYKWGTDAEVFDYSSTRVLNKNDLFKERFVHEHFIDTVVTTGTITTSTGSCELETGEILRSKIVAKNEVAYTTVTLSVEGVNTSLLSGSVSFDGGSNWSSIVLDITTVISNTSLDGVRYNLAASGGTATIELVKATYA